MLETASSAAHSSPVVVAEGQTETLAGDSAVHNWASAASTAHVAAEAAESASEARSHPVVGVARRRFF